MAADCCISLTNALNQTITATYDLSTGLATSVTDAKGNTTSFEYDLLGRVIKKTFPDLSELEAVYDDQNNKATLYDELDHPVTRYYDGLGRLTKIEWYLSPAVNLTETYTYTYLNEIATRTDPGGHTYTYEYDSQGRSKKTVNPDSTYQEVYYDDISNTISVFDEKQHKKEYHYSWNGLLLWVKEYTNSTEYVFTQYNYDSSGNLTSFTDANGNTTSYFYDSFFGMTRTTYPDSTTEEYTYDAVGNLLQKKDANGTTQLTYNAIYQLIEAVYPDQTSVSFAYDAGGNRILMTDPEGTTSYSYDSRNRCTSITRTIEGEVYTVNRVYDAASRLVSLTYPDQSTVSYEYDPLNRVTSVPGYAQFTYTADSLVESIVYGNNVMTSYQYDTCHRPVAIAAQKNGTDLLLMSYQYDSVGNVTQMGYSRRCADQQWVQSVETFQYDALDRLLSAQGDYGVITYAYDSAGNRVMQNDLTYTYSSVNELLSMSDGTTFTYDGNGNTLTKTRGTDTWSYTYDTRNLLVQVKKNEQVLASYSYDGDGCRIKKTEWVEPLQEYHTTIYIYSGESVIYEKNVTTGASATYIYGPTGRMEKNVDGLRDYYHTDQLGSTRLVTDESGNPVTDVSYSPFGENTSAGEKESYLYTGKEEDSTGLYYFGARYYDSETGRFITRDPLPGSLLVPQTHNQYVYCLNNPLKYTDPTGMETDDTAHLAFVILPDGTISHELADLLNRLRDALKSVDWDSIQGDLAQGDLYGALEKIIKEIFPDATIEVYENEIDVTMADGFVFGFFWADSSHKELSSVTYGACSPVKGIGANIYFNKDLIKDAGDLFCVLSHELTHGFLGREFDASGIGGLIGSTSETEIRKFTEAVAYTMEWRIMSYIDDKYLTEKFKSHVNKEYAWAFLYYKLGPAYGQR